MLHQRGSVNYALRINLVRFLFVIFFIVLVSRLFSLQIQKHQDFIKEAEATHETTAIVQPVRGKIYCRDKNGNLYALALNKKYYTLYAVPKEISEPQKVSEELAKFISLPVSEIFSHLNKPDDPYEIIQKKISDEVLVTQVKEAKLPGIYFATEDYRYYPLGDFASQVVGFVSPDEKGQLRGRYGLELYYDEVLSGQSGIFNGIKDAFGRLVRSALSQEQQVQEGVDLVITLDENIQFSAEEALKDLIEKRNATKGTIIVMEAKTGKVLALANYPSFNPNEYNKVTDYSIFRNYAAEERYEPGSIIKSLTMAAALDLGLVTPTSTYDDKGYVDIGGYHIVNFQNAVYGKNVTMTKVLERSINTGAIFVGQKLGVENLRKYFKAFGLDKLTGIDLPHEITGDLSNLEYPKANPTYLATASYGMGIAVTPLELLKAYSAISNKGAMVTPYLVQELRDSSGAIQPVTTAEPERVISEKTAETLSNMLVSVVENGYSSNAKIKGYTTAGKTGTAYIPLTNGKGYSEEMIHSYVGYFPASDPRFLILVKMDRPKDNSESASHTVTLAFRQLEQFLINYYNLPPDEP